MRLLYRGASDHTALVKRFEDQEIEAALDAGWRLHRAKDDEAEPEEPGTDGPNSEALQIPRDAEGKRLDGPTLEDYLAAGYKAEHYPPSDYAERPSEGLTALREQQQAAEAAAPPPSAPESVQGDPAAADDADATDPPSEGDARPEDPEPPQSTSRRRRR